MSDREIKEMLIDLKKDQEARDKILLNLQKGQEKLFKGQKEMKKEIEKLSQTVAKIEVEHGQKLEIFLDVVTGHTDQISSINKRVEKCEKRLDNHDDKFYVLNSAVQSY